MYCPQCATESSSSQQYCRSCGANLKVIGKAVTLSEAIGRSDRGPLPKIKEMIKGLKMEHVTDEVSKAMEHMNREIVQSIDSGVKRKMPWNKPAPTPEQRREKVIVRGVQSLFTGIGLSIFLYYLAGAIVLKLPPEVLSRIPFELAPVVRVAWLVGAVPVFSGVGKIISGMLIRSRSQPALPEPSQPALPEPAREVESPPASSVTERTTNLLR
jgi:hypothetical protein